MSGMKRKQKDVKSHIQKAEKLIVKPGHIRLEGLQKPLNSEEKTKAEASEKVSSALQIAKHEAALQEIRRLIKLSQHRLADETAEKLGISRKEVSAIYGELADEMAEEMRREAEERRRADKGRPDQLEINGQLYEAGSKLAQRAIFKLFAEYAETYVLFIRSLNDEMAWVRENSARSLGDIVEKHQVPREAIEKIRYSLKEALKDSNMKVRIAAREALAKIEAQMKN